MLEYFTYKKIKKHQAEKKAEEGKASPVLSPEDEDFLTRIVSAEGTPPPLPERPVSINIEAADLEDDDDAQQTGARKGESEKQGDHHAHEKDRKGKRKANDKDDEKAKKKSPHRWSIFRKSDKHTKPDSLEPQPPVTNSEAEKETEDLTRVLDELNLAAVNNRAFSISKESQELVKKFTQILKDLINGVPTAYDDLVKLLEDSHGTLSKTYENLPTFLKKLIATLPNKLTTTLAPELLAVAAEAQAFTGADATAASAGGLAGAAKGMLTFTTLKNLVAKPGAVAGMLRAIVNALKLRWPAFLGTNVLLSLGLFVLLFVFWYCYKRGRDVRLEKEKSEAEAANSEGRIVEVIDLTTEAGPSGANGTTQPAITVSSDSRPPATIENVSQNPAAKAAAATGTL